MTANTDLGQYTDFLSNAVMIDNSYLKNSKQRFDLGLPLDTSINYPFGAPFNDTMM